MTGSVVEMLHLGLILSTTSLLEFSAAPTDCCPLLLRLLPERSVITALNQPLKLFLSVSCSAGMVSVISV